MSEYVCRLPFHGSTGEPGRTHVHDLNVAIMEPVTRCEACEYYQYSSGQLPNQCLLFDYPTGLRCFCSSGRPRGGRR